MRRLLPVLLIAIVVAGCGGGGGDSSSTSGPITTPARATETPETAAEVVAERRAAGRAAPFVIADADNSVPTFGSEAGAVERAGAGRTLSAYLKARQAEDWPTACRLLAASTRDGLSNIARRKPGERAPHCGAVLPALSKGADLRDPLSAGLLSLRVRGADGFALFYGPRHQRYIVPMHREGRAWRPTQAAPIAYPPGASG